MSFGSVGFNAIEEDKKVGNNKKYGPRKFWVPAEGTKRIIFLDKPDSSGNPTAPYTFFEHGLWAITKDASAKAICLKKNGIQSSCPLCEKEYYPSFVGYFSIVDMGDVSYNRGNVSLTGYTSAKGVTYQFDKKLLSCKRGGKDRPGILRKLQRLASKHGGDLYGCVFDVHRTGRLVESCGDEWEFVTKLENDEAVAEYLSSFGCTDEQMDIDQCDWSEVFSTESEHFMSEEQMGRLLGAVPSDNGSDYDVGSDSDVPF